ncbi:MAG: diguanylate cyclase [Candidatus Eremiobacteraeota bacterium]|nr:diguanylate cyclase [Candidatus Eremiobacteraeota bacterium]
MDPESDIGSVINKILPDGQVFSFTLGDISGDQEVDRDDLEILQHVVSNSPVGQFIMEKMSMADLMACDLNGDGVVDHKDFVILCNHVVTNLNNQARTDELTGLDNRRALKEKTSLKIVASRQFDIPLCCMAADIDFFKQFNDLHGHDYGDKVLCFIGEALRKSTRSSDVVCRSGGEEFIVILENATIEGAVKVAEKIRRYLKEHAVEHGGHREHVTLSFGITAFEEQIPFQRLIKQADVALYQAKQKGRDRICIYEPAGRTEAHS